MTPFDIVSHREGWAAEFRELASELTSVLRGVALRVDHIGSTAIPGLAAKDVLDVQVTLEDWTLAEELRVRLEALGFRFRGDTTRDHPPPAQPDDPPQWRKLYFDGPVEGRAIHVHVRALGRANQRYALLFRDYLRAHPRSAAAYGELKRRLANVVDGDRAVYSETKDPVCDLIIEAAEAWAQRTGWSPS